MSETTRPAPHPDWRGARRFDAPPALANLPVAGRAVSGQVQAAAPWLGPRMLAAAAYLRALDQTPLRGLPWRRMARRRAIVAMKDELRAFNRDMAALRTRLKRVRCPVTFITGSQDPVLNMRRKVDWIQHRVQQVTVMTFLGKGHLLHHTQTQGVADAVVDLVRTA